MALPRVVLTDMVGYIPPPAPPLKVTLPGGLSVQGMTDGIGQGALEQARSLLGKANAAMAPLGPIFTVIEILMLVKKFIEAVPGVVTNPGKVVSVGNDVVKAMGKLVRLLPQASVPLMVLDLVDALLGLMDGVLAELSALATQAERIQAARAAALDLPDLEAILDLAQGQVQAQQANLGTALANVGAVVELVNTVAGLVPGLPKIPLEVNAGEELADMVRSLQRAVQVLKTVRGKIPV